MKGMIVCGYPGVGKSSIGGTYDCIDLESSNFSHWQSDDANYDWDAHYVHIATELAKQGFVVLLSTHADVIERLKGIEKIPVVIFCPKLDMKKDWSNRLRERYENEPSEKNARAWKGAIDHWNEKIEAILNSGFPVVQPDSINYDLASYIWRMRLKERQNGEE